MRQDIKELKELVARIGSYFDPIEADPKRVLDNMPFMAIGYDVETSRIFYANDKFLDYLGYNIEDVIGCTFFDLLVPDNGKTEMAVEQYKKGIIKQPFFKNYYKSKDGGKKEMYWVRGNAENSVFKGRDVSYALSDIGCYNGLD